MKSKKPDTMAAYHKAYSDTTDRNVNMLVPWYLMAAYAYYVQDDPILEDATFDRMCRRMLECWDDIKHQHKHLITIEYLKAGTYLGEYPKRVEGGLKSLRETLK